MPCILVCGPQPSATLPAARRDSLPQSVFDVDDGVGGWVACLHNLRNTPPLVFGSAQELSEYQSFVESCITRAASLAACDKDWSDCADCLLVPLARALQLVKAGKTSAGRALAVELIGYAQLARLAERLVSGGGNAFSPDKSVSSGTPQPTDSSSSSGSSTNSWSTSMSSITTTSTEFKVPALPLKRQRSPGAGEEQQHHLQQQQPEAQPQQPQQQPQQQAQQPQQATRRHSAPKRRATPQVWSGGPFCITPAAPPDSGMHGETCCDETLLQYWCPISGKRQRCEPQPDPAGTVGNSIAAPAQQQQQQQMGSAQQVSPTGAGAEAAARRPERVGSSSAAAAAAVHASTAKGSAVATTTTCAAPQETSAQRPPVPPSRAALSSARSDTIEALKRSMHQDPASKPAADMLLFNKAAQLPIVNWTGPIKHKAEGRVVEVCSLTLQVPEVFLEEFPGTLYAAEIRHRKSVSLGRHVVCRANLQPLSEHQLAGLAAMARAQLVALCMLQTAELHLVPYFDNKNHVRCVGFLKIKAAAAA